jgi:phosphate transport system protein
MWCAAKRLIAKGWMDMAEHTVKAFDAEITSLRGLIAEMGGLAEMAIHESIQALAKGSLSMADAVIARDARLDKLEAEVDRLAIRIIALRAPVADDLREVIASLKIAGILERIGDYAKNIAKRVSRIEERTRFEPLTLIPAMAEMAADMVHDVMTAYAARDAALAVEVIERDAKVDAFYDSIFRNMVSFMVENPSTITSAAHLLFVARNIERIGDHATNVAEQVYFAATAEYLADRTERPMN